MRERYRCCRVAITQTAVRILGMGRVREYRWFAAQCLEIARATADTQTKAAMLQMAQVWSRLAADIAASGRELPEDGPARGIDSGTGRP
jgi:hypothetical protein